MIILTVNTGSSSVRLVLFKTTCSGFIRVDEKHIKRDEDAPEHHIKSFLRKRRRDVDVVAHRVVHGGPDLTRPCLISESVEKEIERVSHLAPLHNPVALTWLRACRAVMGSGVSQIAVFDTAFYAAMPQVSKIYALPKDICDEHGIRRYGFHGLAHRAMLQRFEKTHPDIATTGLVISIQLGSGCSITAVKKGTPVDTSMGFSPNDGMVMSTRSGDIDSGVIIYLQNRAGLTVQEIGDLLNGSSGLLGVSGVSGDMKTLLETDMPDSKLAVELYCYRAKKYIGAYAAALGGVDAVLFGGGVGENAPRIRKKILGNMDWCGILLDRQANNEVRGREGCISSSNSRVDVMVISVDEAMVLAEETVIIAERS